MTFDKILFGFSNAFRKAAMGFNKYGLKYEVETLELMFPKILSIPIEEQADYADYPTVNNCNKGWFINEIKSRPEEVENIHNVSATAIGNTAYVALNCKDKDVQDMMKKRLEYITNYYKKI